MLAQPGSGEMSLLGTKTECERCWEVKAMADQDSQCPPATLPRSRGCDSRRYSNQGKHEIFDVAPTLSQQKNVLAFTSCRQLAHICCAFLGARKQPAVLHRRREIPERCQGRCRTRRRRTNSPQHPALGEAILGPGTRRQPEGHRLERS